MKKALIALAVLIVVLIGADRITVVIVTNVAADAMKSSMGLDQTPGLDIEGFPFLTQLASNDFDHVHVRFHDYTTSGQNGQPGLTYQLVDADLHGVRPQNGYRSLTVDNMTGNVVLSYQQAVQAFQNAAGGTLPIQVQFAPGTDDHTLKVSASVLTFPVGITLDPSRQNAVDLDFKSVTGIGAAFLNTIPGMRNGVFTLPLTVPFGLRITSLTLQSDGIHGVVSGDHVTLSKSTTSTVSSTSSPAASADPARTVRRSAG